MAESPQSTWSGTGGGDSAKDDFFKIAEVDYEGTDLPQNQSYGLLIQHDYRIRITRIVPSMGHVTQGFVKIKKDKQADYTFTTESPSYDLPYIPVSGSLDGLWWLSPPAKTFNAAGTPSRTIKSRNITVDIEGFGNVPCPCRIDYKAEFKRYTWTPSTTDLVDKNDKYPVHFTIFYEAV